MTKVDVNTNLLAFSQRTYLGDGVAITWDGYQCRLFTEDGNNQVIYLDSNVQDGLIRYFERINAFIAAVCEVKPEEESE